MKRLLISVLAIGVVLAVAGSASAITCTIDQRPGATLLVPYFRASFNPDGTPLTGASAYDTLVAITNNSSRQMLAHVSVWNDRSALVLDFDVALTGFDQVSWSMQRILQGFLPVTPLDPGHVFGLIQVGARRFTGIHGACQADFISGGVYTPPPGGNGFVRFVVAPAGSVDNTLATTNYVQPSWPAGGSFAQNLLDSLDDSADSAYCIPGVVDGVLSGTVHGYVTIDASNYCTLTNPDNANYYRRDALSMENHLTGEVLYVTATGGVATNGASTVNIEAESGRGTGSFDWGPNSGIVRTFYARYWETSFNTNFGDPTGAGPALLTGSPAEPAYDLCYGDCREPLGLKYGARYFVTTGVQTYHYIWRAGANTRVDLLDAGYCDVSEALVSTTNVDEDESTVAGDRCPSPCVTPVFNFPRETQRVLLPAAPLPSGSISGSAFYEFFNASSPGTPLDQAWVEYEFQATGALTASARVPGNQLDGGFVFDTVSGTFIRRSACFPLGVAGGTGSNGSSINPATLFVTPVVPAVAPTGVGP